MARPPLSTAAGVFRDRCEAPDEPRYSRSEFWLHYSAQASEDHLRRQQQAISSAVFAALRTSRTEIQDLQDWLGSGAIRRAILGAQMGLADCDGEQAGIRQAA